MKTYKAKVISLLGCVAFLMANYCSAAPIMQSDYLVAGDIGDTWTYENIFGSQFTNSLSKIDSGVNAGRFNLGNGTNGILYDVINNAVTWYEIDNTPLTPIASFSESYETGQYYSIGSPGPNDYEFMFLTLPSLTVKAGTFDDVLVQVWLDSSYGPNSINSLFNLDSYGITAAVTDVDWWARDVGLLAYMGVQAEDGVIDGGYELVRTSLPEPGTLLLFSFSIGLVGLHKYKGRSVICT